MALNYFFYFRLVALWTRRNKTEKKHKNTLVKKFN